MPALWTLIGRFLQGIAAVQAEMILQPLFITQGPRENDQHHHENDDCAGQQENQEKEII